MRGPSFCGWVFEGSRASWLERCPRDAVENLGDEVLFQLLPVVVDARLLIEEERLGLLDLAFDPDLVGDAVDLLAASALLDLDLRRGVRVCGRRRVALGLGVGTPRGEQQRNRGDER